MPRLPSVRRSRSDPDTLKAECNVLMPARDADEAETAAEGAAGMRGGKDARSRRDPRVEAERLLSAMETELTPTDDDPASTIPDPASSGRGATTPSRKRKLTIGTDPVARAPNAAIEPASPSVHGRAVDGDELHDGAVRSGAVGARTRYSPKRSLACAFAVALGTALVVYVASTDRRLWARQAAESLALEAVLWVVSEHHRETQRKMYDYFEAQRPLVEASARDFELNAYWRDMRVGSMNTDWYAMITLRFSMMLRAWRADPRADDWRVEKDKCEMYRFLLRNRLPTMSIHKWWEGGEPAGCDGPVMGRECAEATGALVYSQMVPHSIDANPGEDFEVLPPSEISYPAVLKCCHLTQGAAHSTHFLKSLDAVKEESTSLPEWIADKWMRKADDWERPWAKAHNTLTNTIEPGLLLQAAFPSSHDDYEDRSRVIELKVYTVWGRALMASHHEFLYFRDGTVDAYIPPSSTWHASRPARHNLWIRDEGHLDRVYPVAEGVAALMGIDQLRLDFFIHRGSSRWVINENSLSSARSPVQPYAYRYMSHLWAEGHKLKWYKGTFATPKRTYELSVHEPPYPNKARVDRDLGNYTHTTPFDK